jgi:Mitochondrial domain of unknown function (DUF1713)
MTCWLQYRNGYQVGQASARHDHDEFNRLMTLQFEAETSKLRPLQERERMSSVLKKRRKKMRKHKYKKLRRRQKFERRKS